MRIDMDMFQALFGLVEQYIDAEDPESEVKSFILHIIFNYL